MWTEARKLEIDGVDYVLRVLTGDVLETSERSDTYVSGSGAVSGQNGHLSGTTNIGSYVLVRRSLFVRTADGQEHSVGLTGDIQIRAGHTVSIIGLETKELSQYFAKNVQIAYLGIYNHSTRQDHPQNRSNLLRGQIVNPWILIAGTVGIMFGGLGLLIIGWHYWSIANVKKRVKKIDSAYRQILADLKSAG